MNQGKLEVVKQEMARVNVDFLRISKLKWTGMGEFNSDTKATDKSPFFCAISRNNSRKDEGMEPKQKQYPVVDVIGDRNKI